MVTLIKNLARLKSVNVLVIGDLMLDSYMIGSARRLSPEAPVAIVDMKKQEHRPGGAGNVALNLSSLGASVSVLGRIGKGWVGETICELLRAEKINSEVIVVEESYRTSMKNRIIADNQQIVRVDDEETTPLEFSLEKTIIENLPTLLKNIQVVAVSDYGKGFLTPSLLAAIYRETAVAGIPVITDPKGGDFTKYYGTTVIKPNLSEAYAAAHLPYSASLEEVAARLLKTTGAKTLMITRAQHGISLFSASGTREDFPVAIKEVKDVTGAGDTVLATFAFMIANGLTYQEAVQLCNIAAGIAIEHIGCAQITLSDLALRLRELGNNHKVLDKEHFFLLKEMLQGQHFHLLSLKEPLELTPHLFRWMQEIAKKEGVLAVFIDCSKNRQEFVEMLSCFDFIDFILVDQVCIEYLSSVGILQETYCYEGNHEYQCSFSMGTTAKS